MKNSKLFVILIFTVNLFSITDGKAQKQTNADNLFKQFKYHEALVEYKKLYEKKENKDNYNLISHIAGCYLHLFDYPNAVKWYDKAYLHPEVKNSDIINYGLALRSNENYEKALSILTEYCNKTNKKDSLTYYQNLCKWPIENANLRSGFELIETNLPIGENSLGYFVNGNEIFFSTPTKTKENQTLYYDLSKAVIKDSITFTDIKTLPGNINHPFYEAGPYFSKKRNILYYTSNASTTIKFKEGKNAKKHISNDGQNKLEIYGSYFKNGTFSKPFTLSFDDDNYDFAFPWFNEDESIIFFASDMEGGYGGFDIYYARLINDSVFEKPINLGPLVNTNYDESYPFFKDNKLFFSSRGLNGYGGSDIFIAHLNNLNVSKVENAGKPLNSSKDDFAFILNKNGNSGYLSSNRDGKEGRDKVYYFYKPLLNDSVKGIVLDNISSQVLSGVVVELFTFDNKTKTQNLIEKQTTQSDGRFSFKVDRKKMYKITFNLEGYVVNKYILPEQDNDDFILSREEVKIMLDKVRMTPEAKAGNMFTINNIYFDFDKDVIRQESYSTLDSLSSFLKRNPNIKIELSAHTDAIGSHEYNDDLSKRRAQSCFNYLVKTGIDAKRIIPKGYGKRKLVNNCREKEQCPDSEHQKNRRVEILFL